MQRYSLPVLLAVLALVACESHDTSSASATAAMAQPDTVPLYDDLGTYHRAISTRAPAAQQYFDQGLRLTYAFNHAEAIRAFNQAARLDPDCAICYRGVAYAYGPNINAPMDSAVAVAAYQAVQQVLTYGEPPDWPIPVRHHLGAVLLAAGRAAERAYREDLKRFPENGWSLLGLQQSVQAQGKTAEAGAMRQRFGRAWSQADVQLAASRY